MWSLGFRVRVDGGTPGIPTAPLILKTTTHHDPKGYMLETLDSCQRVRRE